MRIASIALAMMGWACIGHVSAQSASIVQTGFIVDEATNEPIARAEVIVVGDRAKRQAVSDDTGFFRVPLADDLKEGSAVRVRVTSSGYRASDLQRVVSTQLPWRIALVPTSSAELSGLTVPTDADKAQSRSSSPTKRLTTDEILTLLSSFHSDDRRRASAELTKLGKDASETLYRFLMTYKGRLSEINKYEKVDERTYILSVLSVVLPQVRDEAVIRLIHGNIYSGPIIEGWVSLKPDDMKVSEVLALSSGIESDAEVLLNTPFRCSRLHAIPALEKAIATPGPRTYAVLKHTIATGKPWTICMLPIIAPSDPDRPSIIEQALKNKLAVTARDHHRFLLVNLAEAKGNVLLKLSPQLIDYYIDATLDDASTGTYSFVLRAFILELVRRAGMHLPDSAAMRIIAAIQDPMATAPPCGLLTALALSKADTPKIRNFYRRHVMSKQDCIREASARGLLTLNASNDAPEIPASLLEILKTTSDQELRVDIVSHLRETERNIPAALFENLMKVHDVFGERPSDEQLEPWIQEFSAVGVQGVLFFFNDWAAVPDSWVRTFAIEVAGRVKSPDAIMYDVIVVSSIVAELGSRKENCIAAARALRSMEISEPDMIQSAAAALEKREVDNSCKERLITFLTPHRNISRVKRALRAAAKSESEAVRSAATELLR